MSVALLEAVTLFPASLPARIAPVAGMGPPFEVTGLAAPPAMVATCLADPTQPLTPSERAAAASARAALRLATAAVARPKQRLHRCAALLWRLFELGACAVWLPAAHRVIGPARFVRAARLASPADWRDLFLHQHAVAEEDGRLWLHTHGMEQFGLPDIECRGDLPETGRVQRLVGGVVQHLLDDRQPLRLGDCLQAGDASRTVFRLDPAPAIAGHAYGAFGAIALTWPIEIDQIG